MWLNLQSTVLATRNTSTIRQTAIIKRFCLYSKLLYSAREELNIKLHVSFIATCVRMRYGE
jgi:hypothetical protein